MSISKRPWQSVFSLGKLVNLRELQLHLIQNKATRSLKTMSAKLVAESNRAGIKERPCPNVSTAFHKEVAVQKVFKIMPFRPL